MAPTGKVRDAAPDLGSLLDAGEGAVVTLVAGETRLVAHRAVLAARSPVFAAMFRHDTAEARSGLASVADVEGLVLRMLLVYCYTLQVPDLSGWAAQLLAAADKYGLLDLKALCEQKLVGELRVETAAAAAVLAVRHSCEDLTAAAVAFIKDNLHVMGTPGWADAMRNQPEDLIRVSRLVADPSVEASSARCEHPPPRAASSLRSDSPGHAHQPRPRTAAVRLSSHHQDGAVVSHLQSLSAEEKAQKLIQAAKDAAVEEIRALLAAGAEVDATEGDEWTALHWAAARGAAGAAACLLEGGATVDARDWQCTTPLYWAAYQGHEGAVATLLAAGADRSAEDDGGNTPLDVARQRNHRHLLALLR